MASVSLNTFKDLKYSGRVLKQNNVRCTGSFILRLHGGRTIGLEYKNGLLQSASSVINGCEYRKIYTYDKNKHLTKVVKNGADVFTKEITKVDTHDRNELINSDIHRVFDSRGLVFSTIYSKGIASYFMRTKKNPGFIEIRAKIDDELRNSQSATNLRDADYVAKHIKYSKFRYHFPDINKEIVIDEHENYTDAILKDCSGNIIAKPGPKIKPKNLED